MKIDKHMRKILVPMLLICLGSTCESCFFQKSSTGLQYKIVRSGGGEKPQAGEFMLLDVLYKVPRGAILFNSAEQDIPIAFQYADKPYQQDGGSQEAISMLKKNDNIIFKIRAKSLLGDEFEQIAMHHKLQENTYLLVDISVRDIMPESAFEKWQKEQYNRKHEQWKARQAESQRQIAQQLQEDIATIDRYLQTNKIIAQATATGLRYVVDQPGDGPYPRSGNTVKVNYTGKTLTGKIFDTSIAETAQKHGVHNPLKTYEPFEFKLGAGQVIPGWEEGIKLLNRGAKAQFFIPSTLAYGANSRGEHIQANAILVFEIELIDIL